MEDLDDLRLRPAVVRDAEAIAALHADSWRRHYRGAYSDSYLDGDVVAERLAVWATRLRDPGPSSHTLVVEDDDRLIGFAHTIVDHDPAWGALLENLHVEHGHKRAGIGTQLLASTAAAVRSHRTGLYLWVQEQNVAAQHFYAARGGACAGRELISAPGGIASRLTGTPHKLRYAWDRPRLTELAGSELLRPDASSQLACDSDVGER